MWRTSSACAAPARPCTRQSQRRGRALSARLHTRRTRTPRRAHRRCLPGRRAAGVDAEPSPEINVVGSQTALAGDYRNRLATLMY